MNNKCVYTIEDIDRALNILVGEDKSSNFNIDAMTPKEAEAVRIIILSIVNGEWTISPAQYAKKKVE